MINFNENMLKKSLILIVISFGIFFPALNDAANEDGKYKLRKYKHSKGQYVPNNEGKYVRKKWPYKHVHDNRELGKYVHIPFPYDGGYGPYSSDVDNYRYELDPTGDYSQDKYTVSRPDKAGGGFGDPFGIQFYEYRKPDIYLEYGFPNNQQNLQQKQRKFTKRSIDNNLLNYHILNYILPDTYNSLTSASSLSAKGTKTNINDIIDDSQKIMPSTKRTTTTTTTTTTTRRPTRRYDDEGKWRILRQEEEKNNKNYGYLFLTENEIYAEEQANLVDNKLKATGTIAKGYYRYIGDDGEVYKVEYTVGEDGFVPIGKHIPTTPPVPIAIQKALDYVAAKKQKNNIKTKT